MKDIIWLIEEYAKKELELSEEIIAGVSSFGDDKLLHEEVIKYDAKKEAFQGLINYLKR